MPIKMIAIDMDGTLLNADNNVSARNVAAIAAARARGVLVVLCTGRPLPGIVRYLPTLGMTTNNDYAITYNGALVQNLHTKDILVNHELGVPDYQTFYELSQQYHVDIHVEDDDMMYAGQRPVSEYSKTEARLTFIPLTVGRPNDFAPTKRFAKIMFIDDPAKIDQLQTSIPTIIRARYTVVQSEPYFLEVLNQKASKGNALADLANHLQIPLSDVMVLGDQANDLSMFHVAGLGIAMGNAISEVKATAHAVTATNIDDGAALAIEQYVLN